jgi:hypothetical protein
MLIGLAGADHAEFPFLNLNLSPAAYGFRRLQVIAQDPHSLLSYDYTYCTTMRCHHTVASLDSGPSINPGLPLGLKSLKF